MYALAILRYRVPLEEVAKATDEHRAYLRQLKEQGTLLASGPMDPRTGGVLLYRVPDDGDANATLERLRDGDPFWKLGLANYELVRWNVGIGKESLDSLK